MIKLSFKGFTAEFSTSQEAIAFVKELEGSQKAVSIKKSGGERYYKRGALTTRVEEWLKNRNQEMFTTVELAEHLYGHSSGRALNPTRKCLIRLEKEGKVTSDGIISTLAPRQWVGCVAKKEVVPPTSNNAKEEEKSLADTIFDDLGDDAEGCKFYVSDLISKYCLEYLNWIEDATRTDDLPDEERISPEDVRSALDELDQANKINFVNRPRERFVVL